MIDPSYRELCGTPFNCYKNGYIKGVGDALDIFIKNMDEISDIEDAKQKTLKDLFLGGES